MVADLRPAIRELGKAHGFDAMGFARLGEVPTEQSDYYEKWLREGCAAGMKYLARNTAVRKDPTERILPGAKSVIIVAASYYPPEQQAPEAPQVAKYAYGPDYHELLTTRLAALGEEINARIAPHSYRPITDSVPFLERYWAWRAGLGFIGRNRCLIIPRMGSFVFLAELLTTLELEPDRPPGRPLCGSCRRCLDACPTGALTERGLDARRCVSYLTIEHHGEIPEELARHFGRRLYGCDSCQDVCPFNRRPTPSRLFTPSNPILRLSREEISDLTLEDYHRIFDGSAARRAGYKWMCRNCRLWLANNRLSP